MHGLLSSQMQPMAQFTRRVLQVVKMATVAICNGCTADVNHPVAQQPLQLEKVVSFMAVAGCLSICLAFVKQHGSICLATCCGTVLLAGRQFYP